MSKIAEIIRSGIAPGVVLKTGILPVQAKALKGLRAIENEPLYKHGPVRGASRIAKYFGLGTASDIRRTWERASKPHKHPVSETASFLAAFLMLWGVGTAEAGYITPGETLTDGQLVHASDLLNLIGNAAIGSGFISDQPINNSPQLSDYIIEYSPSLNGLYKINLSYFYNNPLAYTTLASGIPNIYTNDLIAFYSAANNAVQSIQVTNLLGVIASNLPVQNLNFAPTNNLGATNLFALPTWLTAVPYGTNNQAELVAFGTNGVPMQIPLTNLVNNSQTTIETNSIGWTFLQTFLPWQIYGTNIASPYTNAFGWATNFPITAYNLPNNGDTTTNPALEDTDTIPVDSHQQGVATTGNSTNTSTSLLALYQYMTNKNALPPYTIARTQFSGIPALATTPGGQTIITNMSNVTGIITNYALAINWTNPTPVSFKGATTMMPTTPAVFSNWVYWAQVTNAPSSPSTVPCFQIFTNFANAEARINPIQGNGVNPVNGSTLYYLTNYTAVNCVVIQQSSGTSIDTGIYGIWFTNLVPQTTFYYLTGMVMLPGGSGIPPSVYLPSDDIITTNTVEIGTGGAGVGVQQEPLVEVLIQPQ